MGFTAADLIEELREPGETYEALAARLPISLSTVNRWKKRSPRDWDTIIELLDAAGRLKLDGDRPAATDQDLREPAARRYARLLQNQLEALTGQDEIRDELRELRRQLEIPAQAERTTPTRSHQSGN